MARRTPLEERLLEKAGKYLPGGNTGNLPLRPEQFRPDRRAHQRLNITMLVQW